MATKISFNINTKELSVIVSLCNQLSPKRNEVELFTFTKIDIQNGSLKLSATNGTVFYSSSLNLAGEIETPFSFLIKTDALSNIINLMNDENLDLSVDIDKLTLVVKGSKSKNQLRIMVDGVNDYILPQSSNDKVEVRTQVKVSDLVEANKAAFISVGLPKNLFQSEFHNICYTVVPEEKKLLVVSTDRFRITKNTLDVDYMFVADKIESEGRHNYLINPTSLKLLSSSLDPKQELVEIAFEDEMVYFTVGKSTMISSRYGSGTYADYERIIPQSFACSMSLSTSEITTALKQVLWCVRNDISKSVNLSVDSPNKVITFSTRNSDGDMAQYEVSVEDYEGSEETWSQSFNADFLLDYLNILKTDNFLWESNPSKPAVLSPKDSKNKQFYLCSSLK